MTWDKLPQELYEIIFYYRKMIMCENIACNIIISRWKGYKTRVLIGRFKMLRYLQEFRLFNPCLKEFLLRSKL